MGPGRTAGPGAGGGQRGGRGGLWPGRVLAGAHLLGLLLGTEASDWQFDLGAGGKATCARFGGSASSGNYCNVKCWGDRFMYDNPHRTDYHQSASKKKWNWYGTTYIGGGSGQMGSNLPLVPGACGSGSGGGNPTYGGIDVGDEHGCLTTWETTMVNNNGWSEVEGWSLYCFGDRRQYHGQSFDPPDYSHHVVEKRSSYGFENFSIYGTVSCAVKTSGGVQCWGKNVNTGDHRYGPGTGYRNQNVDFAGTSGRNATFVNVGFLMTSVIFDDGSMKVIGKCHNHGCGYGDHTNRGSSDATLGDNLPFITFDGTAALSAASNHYGIYVRLANGTMWCHGHWPAYANTGIVDWGDGITTEDIQCGSMHCVALLSNGGIKCWGAVNSPNNYGQCGYGDEVRRRASDNMPYVDLGDWTYEVQKVAVGTAHTCVLTTANTIKCFGYATSPPELFPSFARDTPLCVFPCPCPRLPFLPSVPPKVFLLTDPHHPSPSRHLLISQRPQTMEMRQFERQRATRVRGHHEQG